MGRRGRCPVAQGTRHAVGPTRISFSDSLSEQHVCEKDPESSTLPEANQAVHPGNHLVWNRPRNSCTGVTRSL